MRAMLVVIVMAFTGYACGGCAVVGAIAAKTVGDVPDPAKHTLAHEPTLVIVENYDHPADLQGPADQLGDLVTRQLGELKMAPMIEQAKLTELRTRRPKDFEKMKITDLGKELGAKQVVYVDLKECEVYRTVGSDALQARVEAYVKVVDVATGQTRFPLAGDSEPLKKSGEFTPDQAPDTPLATRNELIQSLAGDITTLFVPKKNY